jgi:predicted transglutaminase-like cysteine proteinase
MAFRTSICRIMFGLMLAFGTQCQAAQIIDFTNDAFIQTTGPTSIPYGHAEFCHRILAACARNAKVMPAVTLTSALWQQLLAVNSFYNTTIIPMTDMQLYHVADFWTYPDSGYGDCEDYQLAKQRELIRQGWPASDLLMTVVLDRNGEGHAVLMVRTDRGDFVLDNEDGRIRLWSDTSYLFLKRQSQSEPSQWVGLIDTHQTTIVASGETAPQPVGSAGQ